MLTHFRFCREILLALVAAASVGYFAAEAKAQGVGTYELEGFRNGHWYGFSREFTTRSAAENYARQFGAAYSRYRIRYTPENNVGSQIIAEFSLSGGGTTTPPPAPPPPPQAKQSLWQIRAGNHGWNGGVDIDGAKNRAMNLWLQGYNPTVLVDLNGVRSPVYLSFPQDFVMLRVKYRTRASGAWQTYRGQIYYPKMPAGVTTNAMRDRWVNEITTMLRNNYRISINNSNRSTYITFERQTVSARQYVNQNGLAFPR